MTVRRAQVSMNAGWDPNYAWYASDTAAAEYANWAATYATIDTQSLLALLGQVTALRDRPVATADD